MGRFVVTGCAGFVGSHLVDALLAQGDRIVGIDSFSDYYDRTTKEANLSQARATGAFTMLEADLTTVDLDPIVADCDGVFHLAAQPGVRGSWGDNFPVYLRDNVLATQCVFEAAAETGRRVVFASSSSVYGQAESYPVREDTDLLPYSPYGVTKLTCERLAAAYRANRNLDFVSLRYFTVYGPRQRPDMAFERIIRALLGGGEFTLYGDGLQSRDATYVTDAVSATIAAMSAPASGSTFNVGGGSEASLADVIDLLEELSSRTLSVRRLPAADGDVTRTAADTSLARDALGWQPAVGLDDGLRRQLEWAGADR